MNWKRDRNGRTGSKDPSKRIGIRLSQGVLVAAVAATALASCAPGSAEEQGTEQTAVSGSAVEPAPRPHPKSIEALRDRRYSAESFALLNTVDASEKLEAGEFSYVSDGHLIYGLIEKPAGEAPKDGWPVIIVAHGYIPPSAWATRENYRLVTRYYAAGGFLVVKPDYRGHGRSGGGGQSAARTVDYSIDVLNLLAGLENITDADTDNVFLYGHSMGGEIGLRILTVNDSLKGASLWAGVTEDFPENTLYFVRKNRPEEAKALQALIDTEVSPEDYPSLSPGNYLDDISVPLMIHHGTADESVPFEWSIPFRAALDRAGVDYTFHEYPGQNHNISGSFYTALDRDMAFFRELMD